MSVLDTAIEAMIVNNTKPQLGFLRHLPEHRGRFAGVAAGEEQILARLQKAKRSLQKAKRSLLECRRAAFQHVRALEGG